VVAVEDRGLEGSQMKLDGSVVQLTEVLVQLTTEAWVQLTKV